jgi:hypothetical protein
MMQDNIFFNSKSQIGTKKVPIRGMSKVKFDDGGSVDIGIKTGDTGYLRRNKTKLVTVVKTTPRRIYYFLDKDPKMKSLYTENFIKSFKPALPVSTTIPATITEPKKEVEIIVDPEKKFFPTDLTPSTNRNTWDAIYSVGDFVYIRKDMAEFVGIDFDSDDNVLKITSKFIESSAKRPENPSGNMYKLKQFYGDRLFNFEGKDIAAILTKPQQTPDQETIETESDNIGVFKEYIKNNYSNPQELHETNPFKNADLRSFYKTSYEKVLMKFFDSTLKDEDRILNLTDIDCLRSYLALSLSMPLVSDELRKETGKTKQDVIDSISEISKNYDNSVNVYIGQKTNATDYLYDEKTTGLQKELFQYLTAKKQLTSENSPIIKSIDDKIEKLSTEFCSAILFSAKGYFDTYFLMNENNIDDLKILNKTFDQKQAINSFSLWFTGSVVVNSYGNPLEVYHGSKNQGFSNFKFDVFPGIYFAVNKSYSEWFARLGPNETLFSCYLNIKNPIDLTIFKLDKVKYDEFVAYIELKYKYKLQENSSLRSLSDARKGLWAWQYLRGGIDWLNQIIKDGVFDGLKFYENNPDDNQQGKENETIAWMVFRANQIKAANANLIYSNYSDDIRFNKGGAL